MENRKAAIEWFSMLKEKFAKTEYDGYLDMAISALEKQEADRWHSVVKEGNPKESGAYNCTCSDGTPVRRVTAIKYIKGTNEWAMTGRRTFWKVIAWRPLPEPYMEEEA